MFTEVQKSHSVRHSWLFMALVGVALMLAACGGEPTIDPLDIGDPVRGRQLYEGAEPLDTGCIICHSLDGSVGDPPSGPSFQGISDRAGDRVPDLSAVEYLRQSIVDPRAYKVEGFLLHMPTALRFEMSEEDINALVAFMLTQ